MLADRSWQRKYTPDDGDLVTLFYVPALQGVVRYDRLTGYFNAGALALAARGIEGLVVNRGYMRLIAGCTFRRSRRSLVARNCAIWWSSAWPPCPVTDLRARVWRFIERAPTLPATGATVGEATAAVTPWPHQIRAFDRLYRSWPPRLLIAD